MIKKLDSLKNIIRKVIAESKFIMSSNKYDSELSDDSFDLNAKNMSKNIGSEINFINFDSKDEMEDYLYDIAGPDVFISFVDPYEKDINTGEMKIPSFSLNPNATFNTPHGIYAYPFDKKNLESLIECGQPTMADFGVDRDYFHLIRIDLNHPNVIIINSNGVSNKYISYDKYIKNVKELIRIHKNYFKVDFDDNIAFKKLNETFNEIDDEYYNEVSPFYKLYKFAFYLSFNEFYDNDILSLIKNKTKNSAELFSLMLYSIGIRCLIDNGSGIVHYYEKEQMHIITFGDDKSFYKYIGTFKNMFMQNDYAEFTEYNDWHEFIEYKEDNNNEFIEHDDDDDDFSGRKK
jgi:hypothetical protein